MILKKEAENLIAEYSQKKKAIKARLAEFKDIWALPDEKIFAELCFCICTPQSRAIYCDRAIKGLERTGKLFSGGVEDIRKGLKAVRFPNNKSRYILQTREFFTDKGTIKIKGSIDVSDIFSTRKFFVDNVKGIGYKEASHFLRNIGQGKDLAILDVHIIKNMVKYGVITERPSCITPKCYAELEKKLKRFAKSLNIPPDELDILLWSMETGVIFK